MRMGSGSEWSSGRTLRGRDQSGKLAGVAVCVLVECLAVAEKIHTRRHPVRVSRYARPIWPNPAAVTPRLDCRGQAAKEA